jgi:HEAT repeat protein
LALIKIGQSAVDQLIDSLTSIETRVTSQNILTQIGSPSLTALIAAVDGNSDDSVRALCATILGDIRNSEATIPLVKHLQRDSSLDVRKECAISLGKIDDPTVLRDLLVALEDEDIKSDVARVLAKHRLIHKALRIFNKRAKKCYCSQCLHRLIAIKTVYDNSHFTLSYICRHCHSVSKVVEGVNHVILILDSNLPKTPPNNNLLSFQDMEKASNKSSTYINWIWHKVPFDFDEVQIKNIGEFEIEEFIVKMRNDADSQRRKRFRNLPFKIYPGVNFTQAQINALKDTFRIIKSKKE